MKIIDLLNKIANGEEVPKKIYCFNREFYLKGNTYFGDTFTLMHYIREENLNDEVKILEEEKKDNFTGLKVYKDGIVISSMDWTEEEKKIPEKINISNFPRNNNSLKKTAIKVNEIIDFFKFLI